MCGPEPEVVSENMAHLVPPATFLGATELVGWIHHSSGVSPHLPDPESVTACPECRSVSV